MNELLAPILLGASVLVAAAFYLAVQQYPETARWLTPRWMLPLWLGALVLDYAILGPFSYVGMDSDGNLAVALDYYLAHEYDGGRFAHRFAGGQDIYTWFLGMQYVQPEKWLFYILPTWAVVVSAKLIVGALGFAGCYLLAKRVAPQADFAAIALAAVFTVSHTYLTDYSMSFGTGFAAIPLAVYWCVGCTGRRYYWLRVLAAAAIMAAADPVKVFPALGLAFIMGIILIEGGSLVRAAFALLVCVIVSILNWHEVIYALATMSPFVSRGLSGTMETSPSIPEAFRETIRFVGFYWPSSGLIVLSLILLIGRKDHYVIRAALAVAVMIGSIAMAASFPWDKVGLSVLNRLSHYQYMVLAGGMVATLIAARALAPFSAVSAQDKRPALVHPVLLVLTVAVGMLVWEKGTNFARLFHLGGEAVYSRIDALQDRRWNPEPGYRTAVFYEFPNANIVAAYYGFETFDGQVNLSPLNWSAYWTAIFHGNKEHGLGARLGWYWEFWNGQSYDVERHVRLDLLAAANVRYLFSPLPLRSPSLRLLHAAPKEKWPRVKPDFFATTLAYVRHRMARVFDAGDVYVYELQGALPRAFAAEAVLPLPDGDSDASFHDQIARYAPSRVAVMRQAAAPVLGEARPMAVRTIRQVRDGYDVEVDAPEGGILLLNQMALPFWQAYAGNGQILPSAPANGVHIAARVPSGTALVRFRYERPLLREQAAALFRR